jgi:hypothetical protein
MQPGPELHPPSPADRPPRPPRGGPAPDAPHLPAPAPHPEPEEVHTARREEAPPRRPEVHLPPHDTHSAVDRATQHLLEQYLRGGEVRSGERRWALTQLAGAPFVGALIGNASEMFFKAKTIFDHAIPPGIGAIAGAAISSFSEVTRRILLGRQDNAYRRAVAVMSKKEAGFGSRLVRGMETAMMKDTLLRESAQISRLLELTTDTGEPDMQKIQSEIIGGTAQIKDLIIHGIEARVRAQTLVEAGIELDTMEASKLERLTRGFNVAKELFETKFRRSDGSVNGAAQEKFLLDEVEPGVRKIEAGIWAKNTASLAIGSAVKSFGIVALADVVTSQTFTGLVDKVWMGVKDIASSAVQPLQGVATWVQDKVAAGITAIQKWFPNWRLPGPIPASSSPAGVWGVGPQPAGWAGPAGP